jgi:glycosyltransferase involved in cell wall biosynthesis
MAPAGASLARRWQGARRAARAVIHEGVDLVNSHFALYAYPWLRDLPRSTPLVVNFQGPWADELAVEGSGRRNLVRVRLARHIETRVYRRATRVITLSEAFRDLARSRYGVAAERIHVIPGGVETSLYRAAPGRAEARARLGWPADRPILLAVRRLARRMGLEALVTAMAEVRRACPQVLLLIGGRGALAAELQARIEALDLTAHVRLVGFVPDDKLPLAYAAADLTVMPTVALEGFGLVTAESLAAGTPVMGTPVGATPEILRGLAPELVFAAPSAEAMAERLIAALTGHMALPGPETCRDYAMRYDWEAVLPRVREVFEAAVTQSTAHHKTYDATAHRVHQSLS